MSTDALNNVVLIHLDVDVPTGRKSNLASDLRLSDVPPKHLMSLGQKSTFDPILVRPLNTLRKAAERRLTKYGVKFLGGFAVPLTDKVAALSDLTDTKKTFDLTAEELFKAYPQSVQDWASQAGEWQHALANAADTLEVIKKKTRFDFRCFTVNSLDEEDADDWAANGMVGQLYHEVAVEAAKTFKESLSAKDKATHKVRSPFERIKGKLKALAFLDRGIDPLVERIDDAMRALPPKGQPIEGAALSMLQGLCCLLKDEDNLREFVDAARAQNIPVMDGLFAIAPSLSGALNLRQPPATAQATPSDSSDDQNVPVASADEDAGSLGSSESNEVPPTMEASSEDEDIAAETWGDGRSDSHPSTTSVPVPTSLPHARAKASVRKRPPSSGLSL